MPLDPPVVSSRSWDALSDSLWEGLSSIPADEVMIVWPDATDFQRSNRPDFEGVLSVLAEVIDLMGDAKATVGDPKRVTVIVGIA